MLLKVVTKVVTTSGTEMTQEDGYLACIFLLILLFCIVLCIITYWIVEYKKDIKRLEVKELELQIKLAEKAIQDNNEKEK